MKCPVYFIYLLPSLINASHETVAMVDLYQEEIAHKFGIRLFCWPWCVLQMSSKQKGDSNTDREQYSVRRVSILRLWIASAVDGRLRYTEMCVETSGTSRKCLIQQRRREGSKSQTLGTLHLASKLISSVYKGISLKSAVICFIYGPITCHYFTTYLWSTIWSQPRKRN